MQHSYRIYLPYYPSVLKARGGEARGGAGPERALDEILHLVSPMTRTCILYRTRHDNVNCSPRHTGRSVRVGPVAPVPPRFVSHLRRGHRPADRTAPAPPGRTRPTGTSTQHAAHRPSRTRDNRVGF